MTSDKFPEYVRAVLVVEPWCLFDADGPTTDIWVQNRAKAITIHPKSPHDVPKEVRKYYLRFRAECIIERKVAQGDNNSVDNNSVVDELF